MKVAKDTTVYITLEEEDYLIGDNASEFIWTKFYTTGGGTTESSTGQVRVNYASWDRNQESYSSNFYKQLEIPGLKPVQDGTWRLDIAKEISNYYNKGAKVTVDSLPDDFAVDVAVTYH